MVTCPRCTGQQLAGHPGGWLMWQHRIECPLLAAEDETAAADVERLGWGAVLPPGATRVAGGFERVATPAEWVLLQHLGHTPPADLRTTVLARSGVRVRRWPALEPTE